MIQAHEKNCRKVLSRSRPGPKNQENTCFSPETISLVGHTASMICIRTGQPPLALWICFLHTESQAKSPDRTTERGGISQRTSQSSLVFRHIQALIAGGRKLAVVIGPTRLSKNQWRRHFQSVPLHRLKLVGSVWATSVPHPDLLAERPLPKRLGRAGTGCDEEAAWVVWRQLRRRGHMCRDEHGKWKWSGARMYACTSACACA